MINNIYTVLLDLARDNDKELTELLGQYTYTSVKSTYSHQGAGPGMMAFISMSPTEITKTTAQLDIQEILKAIERGETCSEKCAYNIMASYLTHKGCAEFWKFLRLKGQLADVEFSEEFVSSAQDLQALFRGMPTHSIIVTDVLGRKAARGEQRFTIEISDRKTNVRKKIEFPNNDCHLLYLWFLMHPRQEIMKTNIQKNFADFGVLADTMYQDTKKINEKINSYIADPNNTDRHNGFEMFFTQNLNKVNGAIRKAIEGTDAEEGWYIIGNEKDRGVYSISLTDEKRFINLPDYLEMLKHQFTLKKTTINNG